METWQFLAGAAAVVVSACGIILTIILVLPKAAWTLSEKIGAADKATREKIDETRKELSAEAEKAHLRISENIKAVDGKVDALSKEVGDLRVTGSKEVGDLRVIVERIDTTLKERSSNERNRP